MGDESKMAGLGEEEGGGCNGSEEEGTRLRGKGLASS